MLRNHCSITINIQKPLNIFVQVLPQYDPTKYPYYV